MANFQNNNNSNTSRESINTIQSESLSYTHLTCVNRNHTLQNKHSIKTLYYKSDFYNSVYKFILNNFKNSTNINCNLINLINFLFIHKILNFKIL